MFRYEILILTIPEITKDEASTLEFQIDKLVNQAKGSLISFERWGKYRLAYPVRKNDYGVYFLVRFETEEKHSIAKELNSLFAVKFADIVMRHFVSKLESNQSLEYQKPPSLEDTPKRHISSFLEEKGLLKRSRSGAKPAEPKVEDAEVKVKTEEKKLQEPKAEQKPEVKEEQVEPVEPVKEKKSETKVEEKAVEAAPEVKSEKPADASKEV